MVSVDPYERDSDHEYEALEAEQAREKTVRRDADRFSGIDQNALDRGDEKIEVAAPTPAETDDRLDEIDQVLENSADRDPESISSAAARRHALEPDELQKPLERMMEHTTELGPDELDTEAILERDER
jgi:hypothetical protein